MDYKNYLFTKKGLTNNSLSGKTGLKLSGALLLSLAAVQTDAQVLVTNVPAANQLVTSGVYPINVDGAGAAEFNISVVPGTSTSSRRVYLNGISTQFQVQRGGSTTFGYPYKLNAGALINSGGGMQAPASNNSLTYGATFGYWNNDASIGYVGFQFNIGPNVHYGWLELSIVDAGPGPNSATITRWAYDATPNQPIFAGSLTSALPVSLISFNAKGSAGVNQLSWQTAQEENIAGFEIQRSLDGKQFEKIGFTQANGTSTEEQSYQYSDINIEARDYFYRLKLVDNDNTFSFSQIVKVIGSTSNTSGIILHSNPVKNNRLSFSYQAVSDGALNISIFDVNGKVIHAQTEKAQEGTTRFNIDLNNVSIGTYYLKCQQNNEMSYEKIIVE